MRISIELDRSKAVREEWQAELDRLFPRSECLSWLLLDYLADDKGEAIERFVIYQMVPDHAILPVTRDGLRGPNPDGLGFWRTSPKTGVREWISRAPMGVTRRKWELYQQYHAEARLFWIIQGSGGGHKYRVQDLTERKVRQMCGLSADTPAPGDLPFAEYDWRVADNLLDLDDVRKYTAVANLLARNGDTMDRDERQAAEDARKALLRWWGKQVDEMVDSAGMVGRGGWWARNREHFPYAGEHQLRDEDIQMQQFIEDAPYVGA